MPTSASRRGLYYRHGTQGRMGYETGQFGKNHLGDLNKFLPYGARLR